MRRSLQRLGYGLSYNQRARLTGYFESMEIRDMLSLLGILVPPIGAIILVENLDEAMKMAIRETIDFLANEKRLSREDAYALASIAVDFEVTQVVDGVKGIHGMIPKAIFLN